MNLIEFKRHMAKIPPSEIKSSAAWEVLSNEDLQRLSEQIDEESGKVKEVDGEIVDPQAITELDLAKALYLLNDAMKLLICLADKESTPKLKQVDRDDMEQLAGEIDEFMDEFDEEWWQEEVKGKV